MLLQAGATPHVTDQNLCTAAICAAEFGQTAVVRYLIKAGAIADAKVGQVQSLSESVADAKKVSNTKPCSQFIVLFIVRMFLYSV